MAKCLRGMLWMIIVFGLGSCETEDDMDVYSDRGAEDDKSFLLANASELESEIESLSDCKFSVLSNYWFQLVDENNLSGPTLFANYVMKIGQMMSETKPVSNYFSALENIIFDNQYFSEEQFQTGIGVWNWNEESKKFVKEEHSTEDDIIIRFPTASYVDAPIAEFTINDLILHNQTDIEAMQFDIKIGDELVLSCNSSSDFDKNDNLNFCGFSFNPVPYSIIAEMGKNGNKGIWHISLGNETALVFDYTLELEFSSQYHETPVIVRNKITFIGTVFDIKATTPDLYQKINEADKLPDNSLQRAESQREAMNTNAEILVRYVSDLSIIARASVDILKEDNDSWTTDLDLELSDGSIISDQEYFIDFVDSFKTEVNNVVHEFKNEFGI